nr:DUF420 domain-containing protein [Saprospiraceae bacterium]
MEIRTKPNPQLEKKLNWLAALLTIIVLLVVVFMREIQIDLGIDFSFLPPLHSGLNAITAVVLVFALVFIKKGKIKAHRNSVFLAMGLSALFLISYVLYHITTPVIYFEGEGLWRGVYFFFLITHVVLAAAVLPFILLTFNRAITGHYERHKKMARWVFPIWLYVAVTGPICYLMLVPYY